MDSKESNCDAEAIKPDIPVLENPISNLPPEESGCHGQFCRSTDSVADAESNDLKSVVSCDNHVENDVTLRNCSNEVVPCNEELKKEPEDVMPPAQPSFHHAASEFLDGNYGSEASDLKPPQNHSYSELLVTDVVENCNSEEDEPKLEDRPPSNGIAHDSNAKQGEFIEADVDRSHEINQVNLTCDANGGLNSNVNQDSIEVSIDGVKHLNISSGNGSYPSSGVCENGSVPNTEPYCLASNESTSQEKSDLLDQLTVNDYTKSPVRTNSTADDLPSKLKESTPEINQQFSATDEVSDDCHVSIVENDADIDESTINQSSKMVK